MPTLVYRPGVTYPVDITLPGSAMMRWLPRGCPTSDSDDVAVYYSTFRLNERTTIVLSDDLSLGRTGARFVRIVGIAINLDSTILVSAISVTSSDVDRPLRVGINNL
ncbi:hypothetical protein AURDEDRAFT_174572 [Auricularia subglabra TFB-10046 SS5]|uniref:Uncharacterized protein n=1 Tax=Auricularia subglabra (strain TFB-10046 / SS5) TaxID=717982 RepID=J0WSX1_AURST|nr:hypothetical protein AURDEDRAFT_174572 [Auricularia subglabra TFB-10046 SS5]